MYIDVHVAKDEPNMFHIALFFNDYKIVFLMRLCVLLGVRHFDKQRSINDYNAYLSSPSLLQTMDQWVLLSPPQVPFSAAADAGTALWGLGELATRSAAAHRSQTGRGASKGGKSVQYWLVKVP